MTDSVNYSTVRDYLYSLKNQGSKYGIDRMRLLVDAIGHPENQFPSIHVAGTNGKGSVCSMLEAIYRANGYKTGLYTSPHLIRQGERVQVNREILSEWDIVRYTNRLKAIAEQLGTEDPDNHPSFFEFMTAMAFLRFAETKVDIAVLETGLGGRLDATNVVRPTLSIITSISLDHMEQLGNSLEQIAKEKAGIIKKGVPVLMGQLPAQAEAVIRTIAAEQNSPVYSIRDRFPDPGSLPETNLSGSCQNSNAGVAIYASEILNNHYPTDASQNANALKNISWRGRWETLHVNNRTLILDGSHNPEGAAALDENLAKLFAQNNKKPIIVAGALGEFRAKSLLKTVSRYAREIHLVAPDQSRATSPQILESCLPENNTAPVFHAQIEALFPEYNTCTLGEPGDTIVVCGSLYLIGEVLERLTCEIPPRQGMLQDAP